MDSYLQYGNVVWAATYKNSLNKLYSLQKKCLKIITRTPRLESAKPLFKQLKVLSVFGILQKQIAIFMYQRCVENSLPAALHVLTNSMSRDTPADCRITRQAGQPVSCKARTNFLGFSILSLGPKVAAAISNDVKQVNNLCRFKLAVKNELLNSDPTLHICSVT